MVILISGIYDVVFDLLSFIGLSEGSMTVASSLPEERR